ncbi:protein TAPT1 homolog isoform X2 [Chrysoperla carnea]|uniref:protein TAPT1 homolog isoform X2 n=1 Tax=Chrysoperla carnea TaxID=189513 RepID=UPI001D084135|nr:protein TAPT1 homolog isoform X2 [Chrysoperla carnea]
MSVKDAMFSSSTPEKTIRFQNTTKFNNYENKVEDLYNNPEFKPKMDDRLNENENRKKDELPSILSFLNVELTRGYLLENDEEQYAARREKVYSFMNIPREMEKFMIYGFLQCADSFLYVYTFLPIRFILALRRLLMRPFNKFKSDVSSSARSTQLKPAEICDLLKAFIIIICSICLFYLDTNMLYHMIKSQSVIKLYIFYNMLEVGDRLFSAFGQDIIDALFWTATEPRDRRREHAGVVLHFIFTVAYVFLHSVLVLLQATTLNVAINSNNKALLTIMMSNNFVELKGSVFKKFDKNNLFQVSCSDVRERFHLFVLLFIVVLETMKEYSWKEERFWVLIPDCFLVLFVEMLVDWTKHCFITRFNELQEDVYRDYTTSLAYDMAQTRQKNAFSDHSDLVARRMGFIPLPLGVVMVRVLAHALHIQGPTSITLLFIGYLNILTFRILINIVILGTACYLIQQHRQDKNLSTSSPVGRSANSPLLNSPTNNGKLPTIPSKDTIKDSLTSTSTPVKSPTGTGGHMTNSTSNESSDSKKKYDFTESGFGVTAIFSNSSVDLKNVCLNEELLRLEQQQNEITAPSTKEMTDIDDTDSMSKSVPNIQKELNEENDLDSTICADTTNNIGGIVGGEMKKRSDSEPLIVKSDEETS